MGSPLSIHAQHVLLTDRLRRNPGAHLLVPLRHACTSSHLATQHVFSDAYRRAQSSKVHCPPHMAEGRDLAQTLPCISCNKATDALPTQQ